MENTSVVDGLINIIEETEKQIEELGRQNVGWRKELRKCFSWTQDTTVKGKIELEKFIQKELDRAREEGRKERTDELKQAFHEVFYKSGELWFNYIFEDGDTKAEQEAKGVVEDYWDEIISKLSKKK